MTDRPDYRLYLEEKFSGFHSLMDAQFIIINDKLERIEEQTKKTNGRTTILEGKVLAVEDCLRTEKAGRDALKARGSLTWSRAISVVTVVIGLFMAYLGYRNLTRQNEALNSRVDDLGSPVVTNPRGELVPLPEGFSLKMWPKDFDSVDSLRNR